MVWNGFVNLEEVISFSCPILAHTSTSGEKSDELLTEHTKKCQEYFGAIYQEKRLDRILEQFLSVFFPDLSEEGKACFYRLFADTITFHDTGKINPAFQKITMRNTQMKEKTLSYVNGTRHSLLSSLFYLDYFLAVIEKENLLKAEKKLMKVILVVNAYIISRHHSDLGEMTEYLYDMCTNGSLYVMTEELNGKNYPIYKGPFGLTGEKLETLSKTYGRVTEKLSEKQGIYLFIYTRLLYSVLVACDYYGTSNYQSGIKIENFGGFKYLSEFTDAYNNSELIKKIRRYEEERKQKSRQMKQEMNSWRNELFLEAEGNLTEHKEDKVFFLEAPTGIGKSNTAMNISLKMAGDGKHKIYYVYPFNTLVEQNLDSLKKIFGEKLVENQTAVINSLTPIKIKEKAERSRKRVQRQDEGEQPDDSEKYYQKALLDRQFLNSPFILTTHVSFFDTMFSCKKESLFGFLQLCNSVAIFDEVQSYKNTIWAEIIIFFRAFAEMMNMKMMMMSATLPDLDILAKANEPAVRLIKNRERYFSNPIFRDRVKLSFQLLAEEMSLDRLYQHVKLQQVKRQKILVEFIRKDSAYQFYELLCSSDEITVPVQLITGDDSSYEREKILKPIKRKEVKEIILVATQVVEAGVDIDMDIGYKDISKLDSEEQFLGRINRSCQGNGTAYFFQLDRASSIYGNDYRMNKELTLQNENMQEILKNKTFCDYYRKVLEALKQGRNESTSEEGLEYFWDEIVKRLHFTKIEKRMKLIEDDDWQISVYLAREIQLENGEALDGWKVWEDYVELLKDNRMSYAKKQVKMSEIKSKMNYFIYQIKRSSDLVYTEIIGELYCIRDGEQYFKNGKLDRAKFSGSGAVFID